MHTQLTKDEWNALHALLAGLRYREKYPESLKEKPVAEQIVFSILHDLLKRRWLSTAWNKTAPEIREEIEEEWKERVSVILQRNLLKFIQ